MSEVIASPLLAAGLRSEFADTYTKVRNRQSSGMLSKVMDLGLSTQTRNTPFGYFEAAPHVEYWRRGDTIPQDAMSSINFSVPVYEFARRVPWSKFERADDQTASLYDAARAAGESAALIPERAFFDLLQGTTLTLPAVPLAPDGAAMFAATVGGTDRFGLSGGNLVSGGGVATAAAVLTDYYAAIVRLMRFQDGKGQPLLSPEAIASGAVLVYGAANAQIFETAFLQKIQGQVYGANTAAAGITNIVQDASRNVELWSTPRITNNDWYLFMKNPPKLSTFRLERSALQEFEALEGSNNSDHVRTTGQEYVQWEIREGAAIALPYGAIKIDN